MGIRLNARGRKRIPGTPIVLNFGARSGVSWSLKAGRFTYSPKARRLSINTPGIGSVQVTPGRKATARPAARGNVNTGPVDPEWEAWCIAHRTCRSCGSEVGDVCRTAKRKQPTKTHGWRLEPEPERPAPASARVGATLRRLLGVGLVALLVLLLAPHVNVLPW